MPADSARRSPTVPNVEVLNDVVLNQVLVRFLDDAGDHDARTRAVIEAVQHDGTCWLSGTTWQGMRGDAHLGLELGDHRARTSSARSRRSRERPPKFASPEAENTVIDPRNGFPRARSAVTAAHRRIEKRLRPASPAHAPRRRRGAKPIDTPSLLAR